ncbi:CRISPR-associated protein Cas5 [Paenibacillus sp. OSY-SE]|uniref:CRISPR-associated protein Cas5 n=1 Tax=Paenibacillus sp. OSY-SE TaxID=1196323 RepID=UPI0002F60D63|nr:CRISPR-associated protein Cas5 [Paenibacillus sp. OSY-SE]
MKAVIFDVKGSIAHFRRPDTTATHLTYPFITPTAVKGMVGAMIGITDFVTSDRVGIQLLHPVRTSAQQLSMLGKDAGNTFNRPTTMELLVNPAYRVYYAGDEYVDRLEDKLKQGHSVYPTYLGVAFAMTFPRLVAIEPQVERFDEDMVTTHTAVPTTLIQDLMLTETRSTYSRAGGFMKEYLGNRTFEKSISYIYEKDGGPIVFRQQSDADEDCGVFVIKGEAVCLV